MAAGDARCCQPCPLGDCSTAPGSSVQLGLLALTFGSPKQPPAGLGRLQKGHVASPLCLVTATVWSHMELLWGSKASAPGWAPRLGFVYM